MAATALPYLHNLAAKEAQAEDLTASTPPGAAVAHAVSTVFANVTTDAAATAGTNGNVPAQVVGYLEVEVGGNLCKIPYYNA